MTALNVVRGQPTFLVDVLEPGVTIRTGSSAAVIGEVIELDTEGLENYFFADWNPTLIDLLVVAGAAEFCDAVKRRPLHQWSRRFDLRVAVHDPGLWNSEAVKPVVEDALGYLTGDVWRFTFMPRRKAVERRDSTLDLAGGVTTIMPYSDGLDSRAVHALVAAKEGAAGLVRVRLGSGGVDQPRSKRKRQPFTIVPYKVNSSERVETSARSRGFKFAAVTGIAAILAKVERIVVTESGQGAFGPMLAVSGQIYPDYRVHPTFSRRMERLLFALTGWAVHYEYPRLFSTKGETLRAANALAQPPSWHDTRSCWQQSRQTGFDGKRRQCGVCAACMLRRVSMLSAGIDEPASAYVWERLSAEQYEDGVVDGFVKLTPALRAYAVAGVLHMDHLADLVESPLHARLLRRAARDAAEALSSDPVEVEEQLRSMLERHAEEWRAFRKALGPRSFVSQLASARP